jgi:hypothetical protein
VQGYWSLTTDSNGDALVVSEQRNIWDPYTSGGDLNDIYFLFGGEANPSFFYKSDPSTRHHVAIYEPDGAGGWNQVADAKGKVQAAAVHPRSNKVILVAGMSGRGMGVYEATWTGGGVALYQIAALADSGSYSLLVHAYRDYVYIFSGGNVYRVSGEGSGAPPSAPTTISQYVAAFYVTALERQPDQDAQDRYVSGLRSGSITGHQMAEEILGGAEFIARNVNNEAYVTILYKALYGRSPASAELNEWLGYLGDGMPRSEALYKRTHTQEYKNRCSELGIRAY